MKLGKGHESLEGSAIAGCDSQFRSILKEGASQWRSAYSSKNGRRLQRRKNTFSQPASPGLFLPNVFFFVLEILPAP